MLITVKLFATFRINRFKSEIQEHPNGTDCRKILLNVGLTEEELGVLLVNGRHVPAGHLLSDGDTVALFPLVGGG